MLKHQLASDAAARRGLLRWYRKYARPLPWRKSKSPYQVWISEVMLQQTQVTTVIPYYQRFLRAFPTLESLAASRLDRVLELWSGLGYYRRARHLHQAARRMVRDFAGQFPSEIQQARSLPGVGDYTARAVLSIAYGRPYAVLDGNVARVVARLLAVRGNLHQPGFRNKVSSKLDALLARRRPGEFNQALMEIGQTVCLPRAPRCCECPLRSSCRAHQLGKPEAFPEAHPRRQVEPRQLAVAVIQRGKQVLMVRGLDEYLLADLWNFPAAFGNSHAEALRRLQDKLRSLLGSEFKVGAAQGDFRHAITYRAIHARVYPVQWSGVATPAGGRWFQFDRLGDAALSKVARKVESILKAKK